MRLWSCVTLSPIKPWIRDGHKSLFHMKAQNWESMKQEWGGNVGLSHIPTPLGLPSSKPSKFGVFWGFWVLLPHSRSALSMEKESRLIPEKPEGWKGMLGSGKFPTPQEMKVGNVGSVPGQGVERSPSCPGAWIFLGHREREKRGSEPNGM